MSSPPLPLRYLDWASTSPPDPAFLGEAASIAARYYGNPSSKHALGLEARTRLEEARSRLARAIALPASASGGPDLTTGAPAQGRLVFTSGGTEADGIALLALLRQALNARRDGSIKRLHIVTTEIEHAAVYEEAHLLKSLGLALSLVPPEPDGRVDPQKIAAAVEKDSALVAVMAVNNETGAIQDLAAISAAVAQAARGFGRESPRFHVDAVQALGKVSFDPGCASSAAFSAHKLRGPRGVGALWLAAGTGQGAAAASQGAFEPLVVGGGQEGGLRPGTESLQGAWAFAAAAEAAARDFELNAAHARSLEARLLDGLANIPGALPLPLGRSPGDPRYSPYILSVAFPGLSGEVLARALADEGIAVSTGSACSTNSRKKGRRVLEAMGLGEALALSSIRVSTGYSSSEADIDAFLDAASSVYRRLKT